ncbi:hypothetical protein ACLK19_28080 [Escherichia coli]
MPPLGLFPGDALSYERVLGVRGAELHWSRIPVLMIVLAAVVWFTPDHHAMHDLKIHVPAGKSGFRRVGCYPTVVTLIGIVTI